MNTSRKLRFFNFLALVTKHRKLFIINFLCFCLITAIYALLAPKTFKAHTSILPPTHSSLLDLSPVINSLPGTLEGLGLGLGGVTGYTNIYVAILNSRTTMETVIEEFDLVDRFEQENIEDAILALREKVFITINDDGTIGLSVEATTPFIPSDAEEEEARKLAADMANFFIKSLGKINTELKIEKARNNRIYIENRYLENVADLRSTEEALRDFQEKKGVIAIPEQTEVTIQTAAELQARIMAAEVESGIYSKTIAEDHPKRVELELQLAELRDRYRKFVSGSSSGKNGKTENDPKLFIPFDDVPDLGLQYIRLYREVKLQEKLMEFLLPMYEQAKIEEAKDIPNIQILDTAVPPIRRIRPKRTIIVLIAGFISLIISCLIVLSLRYLDNLKHKDAEAYHSLVYVLDAISSDLKRLTGKNRTK